MFLWPPRPERAIEPSLIPYYESKGWVAQLKKNGTCTVISIDAEGNVEFYTRHGEAHKAWKPTKEIVEWFKPFTNSVFVGELLHNKHPSVKNVIYLFDILRFQGVDFSGTKYQDRWINNVDPLIKTTNDGPVRAALTVTENLADYYSSIVEKDDPIDEGIVLKDPKAKLKPCFKQHANDGWMVKCRKTTKNFGF